MPTRAVVLAALAGVWMDFSPASAQTTTCAVQWKAICGDMKCVRDKPANEMVRYNLATSIYELFDGAGKYQRHLIEAAAPSGAFLIIRYSGVNYLKVSQTRSAILDIAPGQFIEVRHSFLSSITSGGTCAP
jgi:hypothetical protein